MQAGDGGEFFCGRCGGWEDCGTGADGDIEDLFLVLVYVRGAVYVHVFRSLESEIWMDNEVVNEAYEDGMGWYLLSIRFTPVNDCPQCHINTCTGIQFITY